MYMAITHFHMSKISTSHELTSTELELVNVIVRRTHTENILPPQRKAVNWSSMNIPQLLQLTKLMGPFSVLYYRNNLLATQQHSVSVLQPPHVVNIGHFLAVEVQTSDFCHVFVKGNS